MSEAPERGDEEILGRLPRRRPGRRSPRRDEAAQRRARAAARASAATEQASRRETPPPEPGGTAPSGSPGAADALAGIARTGVSVATGTVGFGLRAAGGALKAIRGTVERR